MKLHRSPFLEWIQRPYGLIKKALKSLKLAKMAFLPFHTFYFLLVIFTQSFPYKDHIFSALVDGDYARTACLFYQQLGGFLCSILSRNIIERSA